MDIRSYYYKILKEVSVSKKLKVFQINFISNVIRKIVLVKKKIKRKRTVTTKRCGRNN